MTRRCAFTLLVCVLAAGRLCHGADLQWRDPELQESIREAFTTPFEKADDNSEVPKLLSASVKELNTFVSADRLLLLRGLAFALLSGDYRGGFENEELVRIVYLYNAIKKDLGITEAELVKAAVPMLQSNSVTDRRAGERLLHNAMSEGNDFKPLIDLLSSEVSAGREPTTELLDLLIQLRPIEGVEAAILLCGIESSREDKLRAELGCLRDALRWVGVSGIRILRPESEFGAFLQQCSEAPEWWLRLFAAEIMRQVPKYRVPKVVASLREDPSPPVRDAIATLDHFENSEHQPAPSRSAEWERERRIKTKTVEESEAR